MPSKLLAPAFFCLSLWAAANSVVAAEAGAEGGQPQPAEPSWFDLPGDDLRYLLGASLSYAPSYPGARSMETSIKPMWAARWGKWRLSSSGGAGLMGFGAESIGPGSGASRDLYRSATLRLGLTLRLDSGRRSSDAAYTEGLPDIGRTLRLRLYASKTLAPQWQLSAAWSQDALGRKGGAIWNMDLAHRFYRSSDGASELMAGAGLSGGDGRYMLSYFGVPADSQAAQRLGRSYTPGASFSEANLGLSYTRALSPHWVFNSSLGWSHLLGAAAASPLSERAGGYSLGLSLGYRN
ncbi:outer membrane scaffolding protein for murein synthesis (MipA/OmpV family) [Paucibacter oligotrophus]|uniref:Outer membrane scaffolding protein for murein synthesis (MipA/OmpV family) n=1 Tax=Roseateles oligotrophus TaxID=1769250 RepID=A0A840LA08_9BURK|nr:MipA/OmpV family protein [Roseateles oligotrophus]MBB4844956.1 outer membrane scaffolding protein for murein synthesis (MipA/OmpV family) [Roseateles oligotrophus]